MQGKQNFDMYLTVYVFREQIGNEHQDKVNHCNFDMYLTVYVFREQIGNEHQDKVNHCNNTIPVSMPIQKSP